ncbi:hypothetical protein [Pedobacter sp. AJM]|uniref:hypothetical protein n=1 Tax=Pedobacter sp. AJM TaxID=2003629 RepID=UPI001124FF96|nr:hypothetical protein [Pedobacter sp. AJM]
MKELIHNILNKIEGDDRISIAQPKFKNRHIFDDLSGYFKSELSKEEKMSLYYYMSHSEKALNHYRNREFYQGDGSFKKLFPLDDFFSDKIRSGMMSLHYSLSSYKNYVESNYPLAMSEIDAAKLLAIEQSKTFPYFVIAIGEQWLNKVRVLIKTGNLSDTISETILLNHFLLYGKHSDQTAVANIETVETEHRKLMLTHVINSIDTALGKSFKGKEDFYSIISKEIPTSEPVHQELKPIIDAYQVINAVSKGEADFLEQLVQNFNNIETCPKALKQFIFNEFIRVCSVQGLALSGEVNNKILSRY